MVHETRSLVLRRPLVLAPMAGGASTPSLCAAFAREGGLPFLPAGYLTADELRRNIQELEQAVRAPFGVNLIVPLAQEDTDFNKYLQYRDELVKNSSIDPAVLPLRPTWSDDGFTEKLEITLASAAEFVSFTFAHPPVSVIDRVHEAGKQVVLYSTSKPGISAVAKSGAGIIGIQGPSAGGHRATVQNVDDDSEEPLSVLIDFAMSISDMPIFAGGGIAEAADVLMHLRSGGTAVQVGTMFLDTVEAGTKATHRQALRELKDRPLVVTRAFTGKPARAIANRFTGLHSSCAPHMYPEVHYLTSELRKDANSRGDMENLNLWAGEGFRCAPQGSAAEVVRMLLPHYPKTEDPEAPSADASTHRVAVIGAGPRGLAVLERFISHFSGLSEDLVLDWFDDVSFGAGRVWSPYQTTSLLMNTVCSQLSAFPDTSTGFGDQFVHGPAYYEWLQSSVSEEYLSGDPELLAERARTEANFFTSRAMYGAYLTWAADYMVLTAPPNVRIRRVSRRAIALVQDQSIRRIETNDGALYEYDHVVLALGHLPDFPTRKEERWLTEAKANGYLYIPSGEASVRSAAKAVAGKRVLLLGLGLTFFD